jgi:hypothetical protein
MERYLSKTEKTEGGRKEAAHAGKAARSFKG